MSFGNKHRDPLGGGGGHGDDLMITPLLDLFVALIPFLILSVVLSKINVVDVGIAKPVASASQTQKPDFDLLVRVSDTKADVLLQGKVKQSFPLSGQAGWVEQVRKSLVEVKKAHPEEFKIRIEPQGKVNLERIMALMDAARKLKPEDGEILRKDEKGQNVKLQFLFPNVILRGVYSS